MGPLVGKPRAESSTIVGRVTLGHLGGRTEY